MKYTLAALIALSSSALAQEVPVAQRREAEASQGKAQRLLGRAAEFVGLTAATTRGRVSAPGADVGLAAAGALCAGQFGAGARMCTTQDIYQSALSGKLGNAPIGPAWVFTPSGGQAVRGTEGAAAAGLGANCGGLTYPTADLQWTGASFSFTPRPDAALKGATFRAGTACSSQLKIACCK